MNKSIVPSIYACEFCLFKIIRPVDINDEHIDMMEIIFSNFPSNNFKNSKICRSCDILLKSIFKFKSTCLEIEDSIYNYMLNNVTLIHLEKIFGIADIDDCKHFKICRTCFKLITDSIFTSFCNSVVLQQHQQDCLPEIDLSLTAEPVICIDCIKMLYKYKDFLKDCLKNYEINKYCETNMQNNIEGNTCFSQNENINTNLGNNKYILNTKDKGKQICVISEVMGNAENICNILEDSNNTKKKHVKFKTFKESKTENKNERDCNKPNVSPPNDNLFISKNLIVKLTVEDLDTSPKNNLNNKIKVSCAPPNNLSSEKQEKFDDDLSINTLKNISEHIVSKIIKKKAKAENKNERAVNKTNVSHLNDKSIISKNLIVKLAIEDLDTSPKNNLNNKMKVNCAPPNNLSSEKQKKFDDGLSINTLKNTSEHIESKIINKKAKTKNMNLIVRVASEDLDNIQKNNISSKIQEKINAGPNINTLNNVFEGDKNPKNHKTQYKGDGTFPNKITDKCLDSNKEASEMVNTAEVHSKNDSPQNPSPIFLKSVEVVNTFTTNGFKGNVNQIISKKGTAKNNCSVKKLRRTKKLYNGNSLYIPDLKPQRVSEKSTDKNDAAHYVTREGNKRIKTKHKDNLQCKKKPSQDKPEAELQSQMDVCYVSAHSKMTSSQSLEEHFYLQKQSSRLNINLRKQTVTGNKDKTETSKILPDSPAFPPNPNIISNINLKSVSNEINSQVDFLKNLSLRQYRHKKQLKPLNDSRRVINSNILLDINEKSVLHVQSERFQSTNSSNTDFSGQVIPSNPDHLKGVSFILPNSSSVLESTSVDSVSGSMSELATQPRTKNYEMQVANNVDATTNTSTVILGDQLSTIVGIEVSSEQKEDSARIINYITSKYKKMERKHCTPVNYDSCCRTSSTDQEIAVTK